MEKPKSLILTLPPTEYARLVNIARSQVRKPEQQAELYVRRALSRHTPKAEEVSAG